MPFLPLCSWFKKVVIIDTNCSSCIFLETTCFLSGPVRLSMFVYISTCAVSTEQSLSSLFSVAVIVGGQSVCHFYAQWKCLSVVEMMFNSFSFVWHMPEDSISLIHGINDNICYIFVSRYKKCICNFHFGHSGTIVQCEPVYLCFRNAFTYFLTYLPMDDVGQLTRPTQPSIPLGSVNE